MRYAALLLSIVLLTGCVSGGGVDPNPVVPVSVRQTSQAEGEGVFGTVWIGPVPFTYPVRWWGSGTITLQYPAQPHVIFDGDGGFIIEPIDPYRPQVEEAIRKGELVIRCGGRPGALSPSGTIKTLKERPQ